MATRDIGVFIRDIFRKPPVAFPYIGCFHLLMIAYVLIFWWATPIKFYYIELLWTVGFTVCWLYICDLRRWAAYGYIGLTVANLVLFAISLNKAEDARKAFQQEYISANLFPALIFCFFVLFYFRRINKPGTGPDEGYKSIDAS
jgi:hypothetical protein